MPAKITAAELVGHLHEKLEAAGCAGQELERRLLRVVFCLFADDAGIFEPRENFLALIVSRTREDGSDTGTRLAELFQVLGVPETDARPRSTKTWPGFLMSTAHCLRGPCGSHRLIHQCAAHSLTPAAMIGRVYRHVSSERCFSPSWIRRSATLPAFTTRRKGIS